MAPVISVVVAVYNNEPYLRATLASILAQSHEDFELILVDDGSADSTAQICADAARRDRRVRLLRRQNDGAGGSSALNCGTQVATGKYIARCDGDDVWLPNKLKVQLALMRAEPQCAASFTRANCIDAADQPCTPPFPGCFGGTFTPQQLVHRLMVGNVLCHSTAMYQRALFQRLGGFRIHAHKATDHDAWLRLSLHGELHLIPRPLTLYRRHETNDSMQNRVGSLRNTCWVLLNNFGAMHRHHHLPPQVRADSLQLVAFAAAEAGEWAMANRVVGMLGRLRPLNATEQRLNSASRAQMSAGAS